MGIAVATVAFLQGQAWAKAPDGSLRPLAVGSVLQSDEILVTAKGAQVQLDTGEAERIRIEGDLEVAMSRDFNQQTAATNDEAALEDASIREALQILERGGDLLETLEETAAGNNAGGGSDGSTSFVRLTRILETTDPQSFDYEFASAEETIPFTTESRQYPDSAPSVSDQTFRGDEDQTLTGQIIAQDAAGTALTWTLQRGPANGTLQLDSSTGQFTFTPNANYNGADNFTVIVTDTRGNSATTTINLTIAPVNDVPLASALSLTTDEDTPVSGQVTATDTDNDSLNYAVSANPTNGTVSLNAATGAFIYTPNTNYNGSDSFVVSISDGKGGVTTSTVTVGVTPVNDVPVSSNVSLTTDEDTPVNGKVVVTDADNDSLSYSVSNGPTNGTVSLNAATGAFVYTPNTNYNGSDSFIVTISDGNGGTATSTVTVGVTPVNDAPVSSNVSLTTDEDTAVNGQVVATDADNDSLNYVVSTNPANGTVSLNATTGAFIYTPNTNYNGTDSFVVTISDGNGGTTTSTVTIGVTPVNDVPVSSNVSLTTDEDTAVNGQIAATDADNDSLSYAVSTSPTNGTVSLNASTGAFIYTPNTNYNGTDSFIVTISDGNGGTTTSTVTIGVTPVNNAPVSSNVSLTTDEDTPVNGQVVATDTDNDLLNYAVSANPTNGTVSLNATTGAFIYTPNTNYNGSDSFIVTISDGNGGTTTSTVTIGVTPVNDAPVSSNVSLTTDEGTSVNGQIAATDADNDSLSYSISTGPTNGTVSLNATTGAFIYTPNTNYNGSDSFIVIISDGNGGTTTSTVTVGVTSVNDAPVSSNVSLTTDEDIPVNGQVVATDADNDSLSYSISTGPTNGTVSLNAATGAFVYTPNTNYNGSDSFIVTVSDGNGGTTTSTVTVGVTPVNDAPNTSPAVASGLEDTLIAVTFSGSDLDGSLAGFVIKSLPLNGAIYQDAAQTMLLAVDDVVSGTVYFMPAANWNGTTTFTFAARDNEGLEDPTPATATVEVTPVADPAVIGAGAGNVKEDITVITSGKLSIVDPDAGEQGFNPIASDGSFGRFSIDAAGNWTYELDNSNTAVQALKEGETRQDIFAVTSRDGTSSSVVITVTGTNDLPVANNDVASAKQGLGLTLTAAQLLANDTDLDGDSLSITSVGNASQGTVSLVNGDIQFVPAPGYNGPAYFDYTLSDGMGGSATARVNITVIANNLPDAADDTGGAAPYSVAFGDASPTDSWANLDSKGKAVFIGAFRATGEAGLLYQGTVDGNTNVLGVQGTPRSTSDVPNQIEYNIATGKSESILLTFNGNLNQASFGVGRLFPGESGGEIGLWEAYYNGVLVAQSTFRLMWTSENGSFAIDTGAVAFNSIRFSALHTNNGTGDGGDYFLTSFSGSGPASINSNLSVLAGTSNTINASSLLANDVDSDGDTLSIVAVGNATQGAVSLVNGNVVFVPAAGYTGPASFTYTVSDGRGGLDTATAHITVARANDAPNAQADSLAVLTGNTLTVPTSTLLANDTDANGDQFTLVSVQNAVNGTVALAGPNVIFTPPANYEGPASFTYTVRDALGATSTATVNVGVGRANAPSVVVNKSLLVIAEGTGGTSVKFPIITRLVDTDGSESLSIRVSNVPAGLSFNAGTNLGGGVWLFAESDLPNLALNIPGSYTTNGLNLAVQVTSTEINGGFTASTTSTVALKSAYTTVNITTTESGSYTGSSASESIQGGAGDNTINGSNGNNLVHGGAGNDTLSAGNGSDILVGGTGDDVLNSGSGTDRLHGGAGNDTMTGGDAGENFVDVFVWTLGDQGPAGAPAVDTIKNFATGAAGTNATGGDVLDLRDLLQGESIGPANSAGNLADYLHFEVSGGNTVIHVSHTGGFATDSHNLGGSYSSAAETQKIVLEGVNLQTLYSGATTDQQIITQLLNNNKLITD